MKEASWQRKTGSPFPPGRCIDMLKQGLRHTNVGESALWKCHLWASRLSALAASPSAPVTRILSGISPLMHFSICFYLESCVLV